MIINVLILIKNKWENWDKDVVSYKKKLLFVLVLNWTL